MYLEQEIPGKGVGCLASCSIPRGTLILRERPALLLDPEQRGEYLERAVATFQRMGREEQEQYLELANKYDEEETGWSRYSRDFMEVRNADMKRLQLKDITQETATKVWQILETNSFHNGVCLRMSRFNHSCRANAEYFWNHDTGTRDVRAVRKIARKEEICLNYRKLGTLTREERRGYLRDYHHFHCCCPACDLPAPEERQQAEQCQRYRMLEEERRQAEERQTETDFSLTTNRTEIDCLKEMYRLARELKIFRVSTIIKNIVEEGFQASCQGFYNTRFTKHQTKERQQLLKDAESFAEAGRKLSMTVFGEEHSVTLRWGRRRKQPMVCFQEEIGC